jgi:hypothetical protein
MNIKEFFADPSRAEAYRVWRNDPITKAVIEIMEEAAAPAPLDISVSSDLGQQSLYRHGYNLGQVDFIRTLKNLESVGVLLNAPNPHNLRPTYGADKTTNKIP